MSAIEACRSLQCGKDTAKLGFDVDRPCASKRKLKLRVRLNSKEEGLPGDMASKTTLSGSCCQIVVTGSWQQMSVDGTQWELLPIQH